MSVQPKRKLNGKPRTVTDGNGRVCSGVEPSGGTYLYPGTIATAKRGASIRTILGSCVAICLWDAAREIGGMNHYLLPMWSGHRDRSLRFGNVATEELIAQVVAEGARLRALQAKLFGGSHVIGQGKGRNRELGSQNVLVAREILDRERIPIVFEETGGPVGRGLVLSVGDGMTWHRFL